MAPIRKNTLPTVTGELPEAGVLFFGRVGLTTGAELPDVVELFPPVAAVMLSAVVLSAASDAAAAVALPGVALPGVALPVGPLEEGDAEEGVPEEGGLPGVAGTLSMACLSLAGLQYSAIRLMSALLLVRVIEVIPLGTPYRGPAAALPANADVMVTQAATSPPSVAVSRRAREDMGILSGTGSFGGLPEVQRVIFPDQLGFGQFVRSIRSYSVIWPVWLKVYKHPVKVKEGPGAHTGPFLAHEARV
ncbi:hypothetical protein GCM10022252_77830 [Streptosporangium oxazolinicum]|uniref:Uncharacterized protein n=1 Tax=Streptosporangium oxazolinicum TaxID=909287 RepID=A0ABP8BM74_9ACTN